MTEPKTKNYNEYIFENIQAAREETREFKQDLNKRMDELAKRMDRIESRMDKLDDKFDKLSEKIDSSMKELRDLVAQSQRDIHNSERHSQILTSTIVSIVVVELLSLMK